MCPGVHVSPPLETDSSAVSVMSAPTPVHLAILRELKEIVVMLLWVITFPAMRKLLGDPLNGSLEPLRYFKATSEIMFLGLLFPWITTAIFNYNVLFNPAANPLIPPLGYPNVCVGFDTEPARFVAMPFLTLTAYLGLRFAWTSAQRLELERQLPAGSPYALTDQQYRFSWWANAWYAFAMMVMPMLLVVTPFGTRAGLYVHLNLFVKIIW